MVRNFIHNNLLEKKGKKIMHYYYDLLVNLDETLWEFYEWDKKDTIIPIKKIPFIRAKEQDFLNIYSYEGQIEKEWIKTYQKKTICKGSIQNSTMLLISSGKNSLVVEVNDNGKIINRSKLLIEDENNINELATSLKETSIPFKKIKQLPKRKEFRQALEEKKLIKIELKTLKEKENISKCAYLYYEWFGELEKNFDKMIEKCLIELQKTYSIKLHEIASLIRLSYKERL